MDSGAAEGTALAENSRRARPPDAVSLVDGETLDALLERAHGEGVELLGPDGLLGQLTKAVLERALREELTCHLGYEKGDPAGAGSGNSRNGTAPKRIRTGIGSVDLDVPRDRNGDFEPQIVPKGRDCHFLCVRGVV